MDLEDVNQFSEMSLFTHFQEKIKNVEKSIHNPHCHGCTLDSISYHYSCNSCITYHLYLMLLFLIKQHVYIFHLIYTLFTDYLLIICLVGFLN